MYDSSNIQNINQTPLEAYVDAALHANYPKFGIPYCRWATFNDIRKDEVIDKVRRTVLNRTIDLDLVPHLSTVQ